MRWPGFVASLVAASIAGGSVAAWWVAGQKGDPTAALGDADLKSRLDAASDRIQDLDRQLDELQARAAAKDDLGRAVAAMSGRSASREDLEALRAELEALRQKLEHESGGAAMKLRLQDGEEEKLVGIQDYIEARLAKVSEAQKKESRKRQMRDARPFIRMGMAQQLSRMKTKLNLNDDQAKRMEESFNKAFEKNFTQMEVIMDPEKPLAEKQQAATEVRATLDEINQEAQGYLDATQYPTFIESQQQQMQGLQGLIQGQLGGGQTPPPAAGGQG
jgi:hypothetical protein